MIKKVPDDMTPRPEPTVPTGGLRYFAGKRNTKIVLNLLDSMSEWKLRFFSARFEEAQGVVHSWGVPLQWNDELLEDLSFSGVPTASLWGESKGSLCGEASGSSADVRLLIEGSPTLVPRRPDHQTRADERPKKKHLRPMTLDEEKRLARQEEVDLQAGLALSREEARRSGLIVASPEALVEPGPLEPAPSSVPIVDVEADITSPVPTFEREPSEASGQEGTEVRTTKEKSPLSSCDVSPREARAPVRRGVLERHPCALRMTDSAIGLLTWRGRRADVQEFLPSVWRELSKLEERVCLIDVCNSQAKYRYHMLGERVRLYMGRPDVRDPFETSRIMDEEEHRRIIAAVKCLEETVVAQEALAKARSMVRERLEVELEQHRVKGAVSELRSVLDITRAELDKAHDDAEGVSLAKQDLERALGKARMEAEETSKLLSKLNIVRAERDEVVDSVAAAREAFRFSTKLVALRSEAKALHARGTDPDINRESYRVELEVVRGEVSVFHERVPLLGSREAELHVEFEAARAEAAQLRTEIETSRADLECLQAASSQGVTLYSWGRSLLVLVLRSSRSISRAMFSGVERSSSNPTTPKVGT
ncbi:hypothetical protein ACLOJK_022894 [Asimina triloba]